MYICQNTTIRVKQGLLWSNLISFKQNTKQKIWITTKKKYWRGKRYKYNLVKVNGGALVTATRNEGSSCVVTKLSCSVFTLKSVHSVHTQKCPQCSHSKVFTVFTLKSVHSVHTQKRICHPRNSDERPERTQYTPRSAFHIWHWKAHMGSSIPGIPTNALKGHIKVHLGSFIQGIPIKSILTNTENWKANSWQQPVTEMREGVRGEGGCVCVCVCVCVGVCVCGEGGYLWYFWCCLFSGFHIHVCYFWCSLQHWHPTFIHKCLKSSVKGNFDVSYIWVHPHLNWPQLDYPQLDYP